MLETFQNVFRIPDLRKKVLFTLLIIFIYRIGGHIPTPGINSTVLAEFWSQTRNTLFGLYDMFVGGAFGKATVFAMGVMPYISASIIIQLLATVFPYFHKLQREGGEGRKKITQYTRYGTVLLSFVQAVGVSVFLQSIVSPTTGQHAVIPAIAGPVFTFVTAISLTTGTVFIMWLGEQITNRGIGNGISFVIFIGIVDRIPSAVFGEIQQISGWNAQPVRGNHRAGHHFPHDRLHRAHDAGNAAHPHPDTQKGGGDKNVRGTKYGAAAQGEYGGRYSDYFRVLAHVPALHAQELLSRIAGDGRFYQPVPSGQARARYPVCASHCFLYLFLHGHHLQPDGHRRQPQEVGRVRSRHSPRKKDRGVSRYRAHADYAARRVFLAFVAVVPFLIMGGFNVSFYFGGTSVLIVVGVALDTLQQLEYHLQMHNYEGFLKKGRLRGRRYY